MIKAMTKARIDPALGLSLTPERTLDSGIKSLAVGIPAHNESATVANAVEQAFAGIEVLGLRGEVLVAASGCTDDTAQVAAAAGARVIEVAEGKGAAVSALVARFDADAFCLLDADLAYFGPEPLVATISRPVVDGLADAALADLYWRPLYPQMWLLGFFAPLCGALFPEGLASLGQTPWTGQRAARRDLWKALGALPTDFTVDTAINMEWIAAPARVVPVATDDWINPQRPKPDLMRNELSVVLDWAEKRHRLTRPRRQYEDWFERMHYVMAEYVPGKSDVEMFERSLSDRAMRELASLG